MVNRFLVGDLSKVSQEDIDADEAARHAHHAEGVKGGKLEEERSL